jgi:polyhydroxyalkanoate synthase
VAGTTLAATLAILARRGEAAKVASATFLTAQVDFERAGDLRLFVDDTKLGMIRQASQGGYLDGRYMAALRDLYRDNLLVCPDALQADGTAIDLNLIETPAYVQAGREDHIAPPESVYRLLSHLTGPARFVLAGSGHIAGVVNPPAAAKYQYWTGEAAPSLAAFAAAAVEHPGSWWDDWVGWLKGLDPAAVAATGKRVPGAAGDKVIEDAPGRYVAAR